MIGTACTLEDACRQAQVRETIFKLEFFKTFNYNLLLKRTISRHSIYVDKIVILLLCIHSFVYIGYD